MIDCLRAGRLFGATTARTTKAGKRFCTGKPRVATHDGESLFASFVCFDERPVATLLALGDGDAVALAGEATPTAWLSKEGTARAGLDLVAHAVLTDYHVARRRKVMSGERPESDFDDELPGAA